MFKLFRILQACQDCGCACGESLCDLCQAARLDQRSK